MTTNIKHHLKSEFALFQTSLILFNILQSVKFWQNFLGVESEKDWIYWKFRKKKQNFYAVFTYVIHKVEAWN